MEFVKSFIKSVAGRLNLFTMLQAAWLVEFYLLSILSIKDVLIGISVYEVKEPQLFTVYIDKIKVWISEYEYYAFYIGIAILVTGIVGSFVTKLPLLNYHKLIVEYADYGICAGAWMLAIFFTYRLYITIKVWFLVILIVLSILIELLKYFVEKMTDPYYI